MHRQGTQIWNFLYKGLSKDMILSQIMKEVDEKYIEVVRNEIEKTIEKLNSFGFDFIKL